MQILKDQVTIIIGWVSGIGDPQKDIAPVVAFLLSDDRRYITGQTIMADGRNIKF